MFASRPYRTLVRVYELLRSHSALSSLDRRIPGAADVCSSVADLYSHLCAA